MLDFTVIDLETECSVPSCKGFGTSTCEEKHALSPWHSRITQIGLMYFEDAKPESYNVYTQETMIQDLQWNLDNNRINNKLVGHNFKFDLLHLMHKGLKFDYDKNWLADTQLMAYVLTDKIPDSWLEEYNANLPKGLRKGTPHSLKTLAPFFLGVEPYWEAGGHESEEYVLKDVEYTGLLYIELKRRLEELGQYSFYHEKQLPWTKLLLEAEHRGVQLDVAAMQAKEQELAKRAVELRAKLDEQWSQAHNDYRSHLKVQLSEKYEAMAAKANKPFNYGSRYWQLYEKARAKLPEGIEYDSPKQMLWLLRDYYGYDCTTLEGDESTGREVLERLADEGKEDVRTYLEWRRTNKILTAFLPTYRSLATVGYDGRASLHPIFNPDSTRTGRTSSERPNCQQVPPDLRTLFVAREGYSFIGYDAGAIEAKLIAAYTQDETLFNIISTGTSLHNFNTKTWLDLDCDVNDVAKLYPNERSACKNVGFALFYNAGWNRIRVAFAQKGIHLSQSECKAIHSRFKESFRKAKQVADEVVSYMEEGNVFENLFGRPLKIQHSDEAYMKAFNMLIQSSASDLNLEGARRANEEFKRRSIEAHPILFVHDFVCFEVKKEHAVEADEILTRCLTSFELTTSNGPIKLTIEGGITERWEK